MVNAIDFGVGAVVEAAVAAPSGDNVQPWQLIAEPGGNKFFLRVDETRDVSPMNAGQRMARLAVGAALKNVEVFSRQARIDVPFTFEGSCGARCEARTLSWQTGERLGVPPVVMARVTNRRVYDGRSITADELTGVADLQSADAVRAICIVERQALNSMAAVIGQADYTMFGMRAVRKAFLENVRFDRPTIERVNEGLSLASLELSFLDRAGLKSLGWMPDWCFSAAGVARVLRKKAETLVRSASGLCLVIAAGNDAATDFAVGQAMQRVWLRLTELDFAIQPMMSLPVLENMAFHHHSAHTPIVARSTAELSGEMNRFAGLGAHERIAALLRFGYAPPPSGRTGRRPIEAVLQVAKP